MVGKIKLRRTGPPGRQYYSCTRVCCTRKMLKETTTEETIQRLFCHIFIISCILIGEARPPGIGVASGAHKPPQLKCH